MEEPTPSQLPGETDAQVLITRSKTGKRNGNGMSSEMSTGLSTVDVQDDSEFISYGNTCVYTLRGNNHVLIVNEKVKDCYFLKWKTFNKLQRKRERTGCSLL